MGVWRGLQRDIMTVPVKRASRRRNTLVGFSLPFDRKPPTTGVGRRSVTIVDMPFLGVVSTPRNGS